jgi:hypothetical protein
VNQPISSGFSGGVPTTPSTTATSPPIGTYHPYGYIGETDPQSFFDLWGTSYRQNIHYVPNGTEYVYQACWHENTSLRYTGIYSFSCPNTAPSSGVAYWTKDVKAIPPVGYPYTSIPFEVSGRWPQIPADYLYYKPTCDHYPASQFASNFNSYVAACVLPYDPSYTPTVAG